MYGMDFTRETAISKETNFKIIFITDMHRHVFRSMHKLGRFLYGNSHFRAQLADHTQTARAWRSC